VLGSSPNPLLGLALYQSHSLFEKQKFFFLKVRFSLKNLQGIKPTICKSLQNLLFNILSEVANFSLENLTYSGTTTYKGR